MPFIPFSPFTPAPLAAQRRAHGYARVTDTAADIDDTAACPGSAQLSEERVTWLGRPDARRIYATRDGRLITAWTAAQLAAAIRGEEQDGRH
jgi:hypothetical protein